MKNFLIFSLLSILLMFNSVHAQSMDQFLDAIAMVESGNKADVVGDNGKAIGVFQIHKGYWQDALEFNPTLGGTYQDCKDPVYARQVVKAYMSRYAKGKTLKDMARIHNGGPSGHRKVATEKYWLKVQRVLKGKK